MSFSLGATNYRYVADVADTATMTIQPLTADVVAEETIRYRSPVG